MDAMTKPKRKPKAATTGGAPPRSYPDLHDHIRALDKAGLLIRVTARSTRTPRCIRWCAGSSAAASRRRTARRCCSPTSSTARAGTYDIPVVVGALARQPARSTASASAAPLDQDRRDAGPRRCANPIPPRIVENAPCHEIVITATTLDKPGNGARRHAGADLDARLGQRALHHARRSTSPKTPTPASRTSGNYRGQVKAPRRAGHEPVARTASRHLRALGEVPRARQEDAGRGRARRAALRRLRRRCRSCPETLDELARRRRRWSARRSTS